MDRAEGRGLGLGRTVQSGRPEHDLRIGLVGNTRTARISGTLTLNAPAQPGQYQFRYLLDDGFVDTARRPGVGPVN